MRDRGAREGGAGGTLPPGADRSAVEDCIYALLNDNAVEQDNNISFPDILMLQEMQQCQRQLKRGDCRYHTPFPDSCSYNHAAWTERQLLGQGYMGAFHRGRANTVGLYFRASTWENVTSPGNNSKMLFVSFDAKSKGAVLVVLRHRVTGQRLLAVAVHLSVPMTEGGLPSTQRPLAELAQLASKIRNVLSRHGAMPVVIAGDLNSISVHAYESLRNASESVIAPPDVLNMMTSEWGMSSAYSSVLGPIGAAYSSVKPTFRHCIDHVLDLKLLLFLKFKPHLKTERCSIQVTTCQWLLN
jgi:endonuclease/exonuclease/phosphatase family metal-dependent hydrolase